MASSIRVRAVEQGGTVSFKALIRHPMDSGLIKDSDGNLIPAHYIETVAVASGDRTLATAYWGPAVSKDPYLELRLEGLKKGDSITVSWTDNKGESDETTAEVM